MSSEFSCDVKFSLSTLGGIDMVFFNTKKSIVIQLRFNLIHPFVFDIIMFDIVS